MYAVLCCTPPVQEVAIVGWFIVWYFSILYSCVVCLTAALFVTPAEMSCILLHEKGDTCEQRWAVLHCVFGLVVFVFNMNKVASYYN